MNQESRSLHGGSLEITLTDPLSKLNQTQLNLIFVLAVLKIAAENNKLNKVAKQ